MGIFQISKVGLILRLVQFKFDKPIFTLIFAFFFSSGIKKL